MAGTGFWTWAVAATVLAGEPAVLYAVEATEGAQELIVDMRWPPGWGPLTLDEDLLPFVSGAEAEAGRGFRPMEPAGVLLRLPKGATGHARYRFRLAEAAERVRDRHRLQRQGAVILTRPSAWLLRPARPGKGRYRLRVSTPPGVEFVTGLSPAAGAPEAYEADLSHLELNPYSAFGPLQTHRIGVPGGVVDVAVAPGDAELGLSRPELLRWVEEAARDAAAYCGTLAVPRVQVIVVTGSRRRIGMGTTMGHGGASILIRLGASATVRDLTDDWVLPHEMAHLGLPNIPARHSWLEEGLATYLEPITRARRGRITEVEAWTGLRKGMPRGLPGPGDQGLDTTRTWGRTYWGGALFCLAADTAIRERTGNRRGLQDALCGIRAAGGTIATFWPIERVLAEGDAAVGVPVLRETYASMALAPPPPFDLDALWARLGVVERNGEVVLDDAAPLAAVRRAIIAGSGTMGLNAARTVR
jgi:hypothetical protein